MYQLDVSALSSAKAHVLADRRPRIPRTVWLLGIVSAFTDVSSEMVSSVLPIYLLVHLQLSPWQFGLADGLYQGVSAIARLGSGWAADRWRNHKLVAGIGYGLSAVCKVGLLAAGGSAAALSVVIAADRTGKGIRTAPRDALISLSTPARDLGAAFGVHRMLDTLGMMIGPLAAYLILRAAPGRFDAVFVASLAMAVIGLGVLVCFVHNQRGAGAVASVPFSVQLRAFAGVPALRGVLLVALLLNVTVMSDAFLFVLLQRETGMGMEIVPLLYVASAAVFMTLAAPIGRLADRVGRLRMFLAGHVPILVIYSLALLAGIGPAGLVLCLVMQGVYYAATDGVLAALMSARLPEESRTTGLALLGTTTSLARLGGSVLLGALWAWQGPGAVLTFALCGSAAVLAVAAAIFMRRDHERLVS